MIKQSFVFVGDANAHHSEWLESVSPTDRHGRDALDFCNFSSCEQLVGYLTHIAGIRLHLLMTDAHDIVDVLVGTPLGTSDHCICFGLNNLYPSTISEVYSLSEASYEQGQSPLCSQELYSEHHFQVGCSIICVRPSYW